MQNIIKTLRIYLAYKSQEIYQEISGDIKTSKIYFEDHEKKIKK